MKRASLIGLTFLLLLNLRAFAGPDERAMTRDGRLLIAYSPTLGMNVALFLSIDGRDAGGITRGHVYERQLRPGRHLITMTNRGRRFDALEMMLLVRPGQTYSFVAKHPPSQLALQPSSAPF